MAVITLKDGSIVTMFDSKEAIEIIGQELYNFILEGQSDSKSNLEEKIHELEVELDDLHSESYSLEEDNSSLQAQIDELEDKIVDLERELKGKWKEHKEGEIKNDN